MDAAITGLIGTFGGVVLGAGTQALQSMRSRRWQVEDQVRAQDVQCEAVLWQDRRTAYAALMESTLEVAERFQWAWLVGSTISMDRRDETPGHMHQYLTEAMGAVPEAIRMAIRRAEEVRLITGSSEVQAAVNQFIAAMTAFNPSRANRDNPDRSSEGQQFSEAILASHRRFAEVARVDLGISD